MAANANSAGAAYFSDFVAPAESVVEAPVIEAPVVEVAPEVPETTATTPTNPSPETPTTEGQNDETLDDLKAKTARCRAAMEEKDRVCKPIRNGTDRSNLAASVVERLSADNGIQAGAGNLAAGATACRNENAVVADVCSEAGDHCQKECNADADSIQAAHPALAIEVRQLGVKCFNSSQDFYAMYGQQALLCEQNRQQAEAVRAATEGGNRTPAASGEMAASGDSGGPAAAGGDMGSASTGSTDYSPSGGGGGGGNMLGMLAGAAAGLGALCLMGTVCEDKDKKKDEDRPVHCQKDEDAYQHSECKDYFLLQCTGYLMAPGCDKFSEYYCGLTSKHSDDDATTPTASTHQAGEGSEFCQVVVATQFCEKKNRETCPSCQQLARINSEGCKKDPYLCSSQMTDDDKKIAQNTCPTDPIFSDPNFLTGGGDDETSDDLPEGDGTSTVAYRTHAASVKIPRGPASEVGHSIGPSVFSQTSDIIKKKCREGKLNNCGSRSYTVDQ